MALQDTFTCPVCGYPGLNEPPYSRRTQLGSYEICASCFFEFGVDDDDKGFTHEQWRAMWVARGMPWSGVTPTPTGWDPREQLRRLTG